MRTGAILLLAVAFASPIRSDDAKDNDLQGTWKLVEITVGGKSPDAEEIVANGFTLVIRGDKMGVYSGDNKDPNNELHLVLDSTVTPKAIDVHVLEKDKRGDKMAEGLYEIDGNKLRICIKEQSMPPWNRPTAMQSTEEGKEMLMVLRREPRAK
jgi:uncharacterized protein (TIGR03067 family)